MPAGKPKKIIGKRVRVIVGDKAHFEDDEDVIVLGEDTTLIIGKEEAKDATIIGEQIYVQLGASFDPVFKKIDEREDLDSKTKDELKVKTKELEEELRKEPSNKNKIKALLTWFKENASWLMPIIVEVLKRI